ncbi:MAG: hypothetical protein ABMA64_03235 [Myxococcota bacterium]
MRTLALLVAVMSLAGCHSRFKKYVNQIDAVKPRVVVTTGPSVTLGGATGDDLVSGVVNVVQGIRSIEAANRLAEAVDIQGVNKGLGRGFRKALGDGPPFTASNDDSAATMSIEVEDYGLESGAIGMQGVFNYNLHIEIFLPEGKKVYNSRLRCAVGFGDASALSQVLGTVDNVKQLNQMTDAQIQETFENAASMCAEELVMMIRRHGSSNRVAPEVAGVSFPVNDAPAVAAAIDAVMVDG